MFAEYEKLIRWIDRFLEGIRKPSCPPGCTVCCRPDVAVLPIEACRLRRAFLALSADQKLRVRSGVGSAGSFCRLLVGGSCVLYAERPVLCRTHGVPFFVRAEGDADRWEVHGGCEVLDGVIDLLSDSSGTVSLLDLDRVNEALTAVNLNFLRNLPLPAAGMPDRISVGQIVQPQGWEEIDAYL